MEVVEVEEHITGLIIFLLVRVKALVIQLEVEVEVDLDGTIQMYLAELDREAALHGFIVLVLFMRPEEMLDHQHMIFTVELVEAEAIMEGTLEAMELVELAHIQTVVVAVAVLVERGATAVTAARRAVTTIQAPAVAEVAQELTAAVMLVIYTTAAAEEIIGLGMAEEEEVLEAEAEMDLLAVAAVVVEIAEPP